MIPQQNQEEFYSRFLQKLESSQKWPGKFMFKFILKENSFSDLNSIVLMSKFGKYGLTKFSIFFLLSLIFLFFIFPSTKK